MTARAMVAAYSIDPLPPMTHYPKRPALPRYGSTRHPSACYGSFPVPHGSAARLVPDRPTALRGFAYTLAALAFVAVAAWIYSLPGGL